MGSQCWECIKAGRPPLKERVRRRNAVAGPFITYSLIAVNLAVFLLTFAGGSQIEREIALFGPSVEDGEWYRIFSSAFLHYGMIHIGFNMLLLYQLGSVLELELGRLRYMALYVAALLGGSFGALLLSPDALTGGASGAVFGLAGAALTAMHARGVDIRQSGIAWLVGFNLVMTFVLPNISIGGHLGGLVAGAICGAILFRIRSVAVGTMVTLALALALFAASIYVAAM